MITTEELSLSAKDDIQLPGPSSGDKNTIADSAADSKVTSSVGEAIVGVGDEDSNGMGKEPLIKSSAVMEMGVINMRTDLFPWYEKQGYIRIGEMRPHDAELTRIIADGMDVCCVKMRKILL
jgi:hypothetical protein